MGETARLTHHRLRYRAADRELVQWIKSAVERGQIVGSIHENFINVLCRDYPTELLGYFYCMGAEIAAPVSCDYMPAMPAYQFMMTYCDTSVILPRLLASEAFLANEPEALNCFIDEKSGKRISAVYFFLRKHVTLWGALTWSSPVFRDTVRWLLKYDDHVLLLDDYDRAFVVNHLLLRPELEAAITRCSQKKLPEPQDRHSDSDRRSTMESSSLP